VTLTRAERVLQEVGITDPSEIDLEAIAFHLGARVQYRNLHGCEATIAGYNNQAIITVNVRSSYRRKRYSIGHELGHWCYDRGKHLVCRAEDYRPRDALSPERAADAFAADLLMPRYLFGPVARQHQKLNFKTVTEIADLFETSLTATAIRLVESNQWPAFVICHGPRGRKWFSRAPIVPERWFPRDTLDADSCAFEALHGGKPDHPWPRKVGADAWFDRREATNFEVQEQTVRTGDSEILTLVLIIEHAMIEERGMSSKAGADEPTSSGSSTDCPDCEYIMGKDD
jgi:Zn-dependent peptidase ImmA (M78 family)